MADYKYELKIPKERVAILIGKKGEVKKRIEEETNTKISVDSNEGDVFISGSDAIKLYTTRELIKAIGRGFNPEIAELLLKSDFIFEVVNLSDFCKTKKDEIRLKGRIIGSEGKSRRILEELTESYVSVYGKTICIIGSAENVAFCRRAIDSLLKGSPHSSVYKWLEKQRRDLKAKEMLGEKWQTKNQ